MIESFHFPGHLTYSANTLFLRATTEKVFVFSTIDGRFLGNAPTAGIITPATAAPDRFFVGALDGYYCFAR